MKLRAGELRDRIDILGAKPGRDPLFGSEDGERPTVVTGLYAKVVQAPSGTGKAAEQVSSATSLAIHIRYREDITSGMLVRYRGALLQITAIAEHEFREFMLLTCVARDGG